MDSKSKLSIKHLLETISDLKTEHQKTVFKLNKKNEKLAADLSAAREMNAENQNLVDKLQNEKKELVTEVKRLTDQINSAGVSTNANYAVEKILDDKVVNKKKYYLVHWKGYDENEDSWEPAKNLNCPYLVDKYNESKKK